MYKKICVPVDDSAACYHALDAAMDLAKKAGASIYALHVVDLTQFMWSDVQLADRDAMQEAVQSSAKAVLEKAGRSVAGSGVPFESKVLESAGEKVPELLLEEAERAGCDMIAMGTHGFSGLMHLLMGSVAEGVIRKTKVPVLLIRHQEDD